MKSSNKTKGTPTIDAVLGITVSTFEYPLTIKSLAPTNLAHVVNRPRRKNIIKRIYIPLRGFPNGTESICVAGNHIRAIFGPGGVQTFETEGPILEDGALDESSLYQVIENLNRCLLIEANVFIHRRRT